MSTNKPGDPTLNKAQWADDTEFNLVDIIAEARRVAELRSDLAEAVGLLRGLTPPTKHQKKDIYYASSNRAGERCRFCGKKYSVYLNDENAAPKNRLCTNPDCPAVKTREFLGRMEATDASDT